MQELFGSVRRSLVSRPSSSGNDTAGGGIAENIGSSLRKSGVGLGLGLGRGFAPKLPSPPPAPPMDNVPPIRWRKGELIGCGAFGHVYMGMNLDSGELLAVKQVLIGTSGASKEKAQAHIRELEEEVKLLKNLSHPNIVTSTVGLFSMNWRIHLIIIGEIWVVSRGCYKNVYKADLTGFGVSPSQ